ncbi:GTPase [Candidatus Solirubrobacter pratensis]|uniref:GTPase n=1 Tax=Candidatus Solirubrobacter pratensis TaxID=1298857 RepID=UPI000407AC45|nr:GTPase [Candidatus Solirubrobacter pratensis]
MTTAVLVVVALTLAVALAVGLRRMLLPRPGWAQRAHHAFSGHTHDEVGACETAKEGLRGLRGALETLCAHEHSPGSVGALQDVRRNALVHVDLAERELDALRARPAALRVSLFGRTKAGKSTVWSAVTGEPAALSSGRQNTTEESRAWERHGLRFIDQPGVAGARRPDLEKLAWEGTTDADLILFVLTEDKLLEVDQEHMRRLADLSVPLVCVINVKQAEVPLQDFVRDESLVFDPSELEEYRSSAASLLKRAGHVDPPIVLIHALSAHSARFPHGDRWRTFHRRALWEQSKIEEVLRAIEDCAPDAAEYRRDAALDVALACHARFDRELFAVVQRLRRVRAEIVAALPSIEAILEETEADARARRSRIGEMLAASHERAIGVAVRAAERPSAAQLEADLLGALDLDGIRVELESELDEIWQRARTKLEELEGDRKLVASLHGRLDVDESWAQIRRAAKRERFTQRLATVADVVAGALTVLSLITGAGGRVGAIVSKALGSLAMRQKKKAEARREEAIKRLQSDLGAYMDALRDDFGEAWDQAVGGLLRDLDEGVLGQHRRQIDDLKTSEARLARARATGARVARKVAAQRFATPQGIVLPVSPRAALVESHVRELRRAIALRNDGAPLEELLAGCAGLLVSLDDPGAQNGSPRRRPRGPHRSERGSDARPVTEEAARLESLMSAMEESDAD